MLAKENDPSIETLVNDIMSSIVSIKETSGLTNLTESMKTTVTSGISDLRSMVCMKAFEFFKVNDFEPTKEVIPIMRDVVKVALEKGAI